jgi:hypothetical protein
MLSISGIMSRCHLTINTVSVEADPRVRPEEKSVACTGYLDQPFKNRPFETEKDRHPLLAHRGGLGYNQTLSQAYACLNNDTLR